MRTIVQAPPPETDTTLFVALLAGTFSEPEDFVREGFPQALRAHRIAAEVAMAQVSAAWFADGTVVERIRSQVVRPAAQRGRERVWLAGISLGGLAALSYAARHEADLAGIVLISPYPATREVLRELEAAGGASGWEPEIPPGGDLEREAWRWLANSAGSRAPVHCYFATGDRFASGQRRMASHLPAERVGEIAGGHDWPAWRALWDEFLRRSGSALQ
jgi:pimeloyl-ACP methyl ester carboxylesterase